MFRGVGFRGLGFRVLGLRGLGYRGLGVQGLRRLGLGVLGVQGLGFRSLELASRPRCTRGSILPCILRHTGVTLLPGRCRHGCLPKPTSSKPSTTHGLPPPP